MANVTLPEAPAIASFLSSQIVGKELPITNSELASAISEIELETQVKGASFIKVHLIDPDWKLATSGLVDVNREGLLPKREVEFPKGTGWRWTLCAVEGSNDFTSGSNLVLTFEDRIVSELRKEWGPKRASPGFNIRAEFIKSLVHEVALHGQPAIHTHIPSAEGKFAALDKNVTAVERSIRQAGESSALTPEAEGVAAAQQSKSGGISAATKLTIGGVAATATQIREANTMLGVASEEKAGQVASEALIFAGIAESKLGNDASSFSPNSAGYYGVLQGSSQTWPDPHDTTGMTHSFLRGGKGFQSGGAIALAQSSHDPVEIAVKVEVPSIWPENAYASEAGYGGFLNEARALIAAYGGGGIPGGSAPEAEGAAAGSGESKAGEVTRGTTQDPDEDSWDCIQRLAGAVNFNAFTNGQNFFYMSGPELAGQKPSLFLDVPANRVSTETPRGKPVSETGVIQVPLSYTFDDTALEYLQNRKVHGKVQRRSKTAKPQTPAEIRLNLVCGITDYRAGDVFVFRNSGPINGRWIITNTTRNCLKDTFTQFILAPPSAPLLETEEGKPEGKQEGKQEVSATAPEGAVPAGVPAPASGAYRSPPAQGPEGIGSFQGIEVALWIIPELEYAQQSTDSSGKPKKAWGGKITSGYRPGPDPHTATGESEHQKKRYPGGAVDFGGYEAFAERAEFFACVDGYKGLPLIPAQFAGDGGHASGTGR